MGDVLVGHRPAALAADVADDDARRLRVRGAVARRVTERIARIVRSLPYSRFGSFGTLSVTGSHVTQSGPSTGSWVPSIRLPSYGRPTEVA